MLILNHNTTYLTYAMDHSLFIFKPDLQRMRVAEGRLVVEHILPIVGEFYINMAQPRRNTIDLRANTTSALNQPRTGNVLLRAFLLGSAYEGLSIIRTHPEYLSGP